MTKLDYSKYNFACPFLMSYVMLDLTTYIQSRQSPESTAYVSAAASMMHSYAHMEITPQNAESIVQSTAQEMCIVPTNKALHEWADKPQHGPTCSMCANELTVT